MSKKVLEVMRMQPDLLAPEEEVFFDTLSVTSPEIEYDETTGAVIFHEPGQYLVDWWAATETAPKGVVELALRSSQGDFIRGCSPVKTGQVSGSCVLDIKTEDVEAFLINATDHNLILASATTANAHLLVTSTGCTSPIRAYNANLSTSGSFIQIPLGNGVYYRLEYWSDKALRFTLLPINEPARYDYRRLSANDGTIGFEGLYADNQLLSMPMIMDSPIYNNSREMHSVWIRVQDPVSTLWSMYTVDLFASHNGARVTIWVTTISEGVSYYSN